LIDNIGTGDIGTEMSEQAATCSDKTTRQAQKPITIDSGPMPTLVLNKFQKTRWPLISRRQALETQTQNLRLIPAPDSFSSCACGRTSDVQPDNCRAVL